MAHPNILSELLQEDSDKSKRVMLAIASNTPPMKMEELSFEINPNAPRSIKPI